MTWSRAMLRDLTVCSCDVKVRNVADDGRVVLGRPQRGEAKEWEQSQEPEFILAKVSLQQPGEQP